MSSSDELKVPSQPGRTYDHAGNDTPHNTPNDREHDYRDGERDGLADDLRDDPRDDLKDDPKDDVAHREPVEDVIVSDEPVRDGEYARDGDELAASEAGTDRISPYDDDPHDGTAIPGTGVAATPAAPAATGRDPYADQAPAHAAPDDIVLFDQDPTQVQARWRDLQASFVDDPGEAVRRADGLVGEVVESLTSSLTSRTEALRGRWKDAGEAETEQLRLALRDYRNVLERLLALSGSQDHGAPHAQGISQDHGVQHAQGISQDHGVQHAQGMR
ncbi:hypothetical protein ACFFR3_13790 [Nonomuraea salmonea]|uniref:WXG100 family type VII secretion target n=1 Tax=Nonomuraea salmonea TaxID=46181 RepID=A0ABV5NJX9_9ACTN